jgi:hypothetical protein
LVYKSFTFVVHTLFFCYHINIMKNVFMVVILLVFLLPPFATICYGVEETPQFSDVQKQLYIDEAALHIDAPTLFDVVEEDNAIYIIDSENNFSSVISCDKMDDSTLELLREHYNDYSSTDEEMFGKFEGYKKSYFSALQNYYKRAFLYGSDADSSESNMKIFGEYIETIYGQEAESVLFNTITSSVYGSIEKTHIYFSISVPASRSLYSINFTAPKGSLDEKTLESMNEVIRSVHIPGLSEQVEQLKVFNDDDAINSANMGIYPDEGIGKDVFTKFANVQSGYKISIPPTYIPYRSNGIIDSFDYKSYKINYNHFLSITSEKLFDISKTTKENEEILEALYGENISIIEEGAAIIGANPFYFINYKFADAEGTIYVLNYSIVKDNYLYTFQLNSRYEKPGEELKSEFIRVLSSLEFTQIPPSSSPNVHNFKKFKANSGEYAFSYPDGWNLMDITSQSETKRGLTVVSPELSGSLNVQLMEGEFLTKLDPPQALSLVLGSNPFSMEQHIKEYSAPYIGKTKKLLACSYQRKNGSVYLYKLINFIDESERDKLCYSVDIIRNTKVYSLFITVSDYMTSHGDIINPDTAASLNFIAQSFDAVH